MPPRKSKAKAPQKSKASKPSSETNSKEEPPKNINPYKVLDLPKECSAADIRTKYLKLALRLHPDKAKPEEREAAHVKFQELAFAYAVLSDEARRKRYDVTGRTDQHPHEGDDGFDWAEFYKRQFEDVVTGESLEKFKKEYQDSEEEREAILSAYTDGKGDIAYIFSMVMCSDEVADEERFRKIIRDAIDKGEVEPYAKFLNESEAAKQKRKRKSAKESKAAMEYAKELGVYEKLFGKDGGGKSGTEDVDMADGNDEGDGEDDTIDLNQESDRNEDQEGDEEEERLEKGEEDGHDSDATEEIWQPEESTSKRSDSEGHPNPCGFTSINPPAPKKPPKEPSPEPTDEAKSAESTSKPSTAAATAATAVTTTTKAQKSTKPKAKSSPKTTSEKTSNTEDTQPPKPKSQPKKSTKSKPPETEASSATANGTTTNSKSKPKPKPKQKPEPESTFSNLASLIQDKNKNKMADVIANLEAKYVNNNNASTIAGIREGKIGRKRKAGDSLLDGEEQGAEPTEEEFLAAGNKLGMGNKGRKGRGKKEDDGQRHGEGEERKENGGRENSLREVEKEREEQEGEEQEEEEKEENLKKEKGRSKVKGRVKTKAEGRNGKAKTGARGGSKTLEKEKEKEMEEANEKASGKEKEIVEVEVEAEAEAVGEAGGSTDSTTQDLVPDPVAGINTKNKKGGTAGNPAKKRKVEKAATEGTRKSLRIRRA